MQGGKSSTSAVEAAKEAAANVGASSWAGKEKTKAVVQEKVEKAKAHDDPAARASAEARKQERIHEVEAEKRDAMRHNYAAKERATASAYHPTTTGHGAAVAVDRSSAATTTDQANGAAAGAVEVEGIPPVAAAATEAAVPATHDDVPSGGSDDGYLPPGAERGVGKSDDYLPAAARGRRTAGGHSA